MMEEEVVVTEARDLHAWVEKTHSSACGNCQQLCVSSTAEKLFKGRQEPLQVHAPIKVEAGDRVIIGIREAALLKGFLLIYLLPLLALFAGALSGRFISSLLSVANSESMSLAGGLLGFSLCLLVIKVSHILDRNRLKPVVLRKITD
jgi:sigma-E factor negative regulatory protein RseC